MSTSQKSNPDEIIWDGVDENKSWWSKRSSLEQKLIMSLVGVTVLSVGVLVYMGIKPTEGVNTEVACDTPQCLVSATELINRLDTTVDPCEDFFKFACGKYIKNTVKDDIDNEILNILKSPESSEDHYMVKNEKRLFQTCINESELEEESLPIIQSMIRELNEWPVVVGHKWRERQFDWAETLIKLSKSGYHDKMILQIYKLTDSSNNALILELTLGTITYVKKEHKDAYIKYMSDVAELFGAEPNRAAIEMEKVSDFMEKLLELSAKVGHGNKTKISIREFQDEYDDVDWFRFISAFASPLKIVISDYGEFPSTDFMDAFTTLMSKTPKRILANYIVWSVIEKLVPFMPKAFRELKANYTCATNPDHTKQDRETLCKLAIQDLFIPVPSWMIYTRNHLTKEKQEHIGMVFNDIKEEATALLQNSAWIEQGEKGPLLQKLNDTSAVIGTEWDYENDSVFEKYEPNTNRRSYRGSFLSMYLNRKKQKKNFLTHTDESRLDISMNSYTTGTLPVYYLKDRKLELPVGMFPTQFYKLENPMYLTYSVFGKAIAQEIIHTLMMAINITDWPQNPINYNDNAKCFFKSTDYVDPTFSPTDLLFIQDGVLANIAALKIAYNVYQRYIEVNGEDAIPLGVEYTANQLFWIASVSYECYEYDIDPFQSHLQKIYEKNIPFINSEDFANDFSCSAQSKMNTVDKCKIVE